MHRNEKIKFIESKNLKHGNKRKIPSAGEMQTR